MWIARSIYKSSFQKVSNPPAPNGGHQAVGCGRSWEVESFENVGPPSPHTCILCGALGVSSRPGPPRTDPGKYMKITLNSIRPGNTQMLQKSLQSLTKLTQITPKWPPESANGDLWKCVFYHCKTLLFQFPRHPKPSKKQIQRSADNFAT